MFSQLYVDTPCETVIVTVTNARCCAQVLTTFTSDSRDVVDVRRSEASLKAQVEELQGRLEVWHDILYMLLCYFVIFHVSFMCALFCFYFYIQAFNCGMRNHARAAPLVAVLRAHPAPITA